jgi:hypothetical protein
MDNGNDDADAVATQRTCPACGGGDGKFECGWCLLGLVNERQYQTWRKWRMDQRTISATHSVLEGICLDVLKKLDASSKSEARLIAQDGRYLLERWKGTDDDEQRRKLAIDLMSWHRKALEALAK